MIGFWENRKKPYFWAIFASLWPKTGQKFFFWKIRLRHFLTIIVLHDHAKNQKISMSQSREKLITDGRTNERTDERKISPFYRTSSPIGAAALPPPMKTKKKVEQGKGTGDHLMPLGYLFFSFCFFFLSLPFFSGRSPRREALQGTRPWTRAHPGPRLNQP